MDDGPATESGTRSGATGPAETPPGETPLAETRPSGTRSAEPRVARSTADRGRRFRPRQIDLGDGGKLVLHAVGAIEHVDATGQVLGSWAPGDPDWARHAIRFGLRPQDATVAPHGPDGGTKLPRW